MVGLFDSTERQGFAQDFCGRMIRIRRAPPDAHGHGAAAPRTLAFVGSPCDRARDYPQIAERSSSDSCCR
jgi:hypothetical protein